MHLLELRPWALGKRQVDPGAMPDDAARWQETLAGISVPTLLIYGESALGGLISEDVASEAMRINRHIRSIQIKGAGHNIRRENFDRFVSAVREFLNETPESADRGEKSLGYS